MPAALAKTSFSARSSFPKTMTRAHNLDGQEIPGPLEPLANVLLVKVKDAEDMSAGGIVLPDQAKEKPTEGEVVAAGPGRQHPETAVLMPMPVKPGSKVLYGKFDGMSVIYDGAPHVLIRDDDILLTWTGSSMTLDAVETVRDRILVKVKKAQEKSAGGILLAPSMTKARPTEGEVIKVGPGRIASTGEVADVKVKPGDGVKFKDFAGTEIKIQDENYLVMYSVDVLARW
ncbi:hypothetical protein NSK_002237 [Nannochloropsis salina CCMP1776]|uniref:20 kDa chaperonin, chloroplastic n=1 Tax=Nannochloropsis salina CCMP1776 TaxID=1027361 RepID=A0A4D9D557_9STRA|nr:hypothetical protein NSK_002237 [Nannochloropsis salina CCMP1776]|eukprot:TFJ86580.1 hypothetical protein NSK_002237 [Nannochloropsis salina CCMP1776]